MAGQAPTMGLAVLPVTLETVETEQQVLATPDQAALAGAAEEVRGSLVGAAAELEYLVKGLVAQEEAALQPQVAVQAEKQGTPLPRRLPSLMEPVLVAVVRAIQTQAVAVGVVAGFAITTI